MKVLSTLRLLIKLLGSWQKQMEHQNQLLERIANSLDPLPVAAQDEPQIINTDYEEQAVEEFRERQARSGYKLTE